MYEVDNDREKHVVDLTYRTGSYRIWYLTGIPYKYGIVTIFMNLESGGLCTSLLPKGNIPSNLPEDYSTNV